MGLLDVLARWIGIVPAVGQIDITVRESTTQELTVMKNQLWYRGDPVELEQFYYHLAQYSLDGFSHVPATRFWASVPTKDNIVRKFHSGLPRLIADKLASIVADDMNEPEMDQNALTRWKEIAEETNFDELLKDAVTRALAEGDGAFKICLDPDISELPLIEFFSGNNVDFQYKRGKLIEIIFLTDYYVNTKHYKLCEHYGPGYVRYELKDDAGKIVPLETVPECAGLTDVSYDGDFIMAVPIKFFNSAKFKGRGESIFEGKGDDFDALDEIISTWLDAVRAGRVKQYIPEALIPRDEDTGALRKPNVFNAYYVKNTDLSEEADNKIEVIQGKIEVDSLLSSYTTFLDLCLQGLVSPSTLGIDVKKLDNAESQREKEKATLYTRDTLIGVLMKKLPELVEVVLQTDDINKGQAAGEYEATFEWGQYANPSFEAMVETIGKAKQQGIMSIEQCVEELYGDTMTAEEKADEVARLKAEQNPTVSLDQPAVNDDFKKADVNGDEGAGGEAAAGKEVVVKGFGEGNG